MDRIVFVTYNRSRKPDFQLQTTAHKKGNQVYFRKAVQSEASAAHLRAIASTYEQLDSLRADTTDIAKILHRPTEKHIDFEYVSGESLEKQLLDAVLSGDDARATKTVDRWIGFLKKLPSSKPHDHSYDVSTFGPGLFDFFDGSTCIKPGLLDSNLDNIIDHDGKLTLIDYEWCFGHCLPYDYIVARGLLWFCLRHTEILRLHADRIKLVSLAENIVFPAVIYNTYMDKRTVEKVLDIEWNHFQRWVTGLNLSVNAPALKVNRTVSKPLFALEELERLRTEVQQLARENHERNQEIEAIKQSRSYKTARALQKVRQASRLRKQ